MNAKDQSERRAVFVGLPSGNEVELTILRAGVRVLIDANWAAAPTPEDRRDLELLLGMGGRRAVKLNIRTEKQRAAALAAFLSMSGEPGEVQ